MTLSRTGLGLLLCAVTLMAQTPPDSSRYYYLLSIRAYSEQDFSTYLALTRKALTFAPDNYTLGYNLATAYALNGQSALALQELNKLVDKGLGLVAENDPDFDSLRNSAGFRALVKKIQRAKKPVRRSKTFAIIREKDLLPKGLTGDPATGNFYLGSFYKDKIVRIDPQGRVSDFIGEQQDGLGPVLGLKVDAAHHWLWAISSCAMVNDRTPRQQLGMSYVYKFDLGDGKLLRKYALNRPRGHLLNDLTLDNLGNVYICDGFFPAVYRLDVQRDTLEKFIDLRGFIHPNGIALSDDDKVLYVAHANGILYIPLATRQISALPYPENVLTANCEGLKFHKGNLIGVQNFLNRVVLFKLNPSGDAIVKMKILESQNPEFSIPTSGTLADNAYLFIANSQLNSFDQNGKLFPPEKLRDVVILKTKL